ncbi:MAG: peptidase U32 family protein, partial [Candidatus Fimenecus sp.]
MIAIDEKNNLLPEVLAPAGDLQSLKAAVSAGADAVYFGLSDFNARRNAGNISLEELPFATDYCRKRKVKAYITLNTLIKDSEFESFKKYLDKIAIGAPDALIMADLGAAYYCKKTYPDLPIHASTQMSVGTLDGLQLLKSLGFERAVLPRELSKENIKHLCEKSPIELEVFVHGALCMSVSGQCLMSSVFGTRSGNRGLCAQACRLPFHSENGGEHDLSLKDLSLIEHINELKKFGISSFKIEGRMKRPEYVYAAVKTVKKALCGEKNTQ